MKTFNQIVNKGEVTTSIELSIDERIKSRIIENDVNGNEVAICVERGTVLHDGDLLVNEDGEILKIISAPEEVSTIRAKDAISLTKLAYHLGNRHVPLQISQDGFLRYQVDHVLDDMVVKLGGTLTHEKAKFEPESAAYANHHHDHEHHHDEEHGHHHEHHHE